MRDYIKSKKIPSAEIHTKFHCESEKITFKTPVTEIKRALSN